ncbi:MAG: CTP synthase C-terminal region-related (seleno)protein [Acidimicrobiales bacterium]
MVRIGVIGDYDPANETHLATTAAVRHGAGNRAVPAQVTWIPTDEVGDNAEEALARVDGLIIAPGSPYRSLTGALTAITHARTHDVPLLGTCGGFQHVVLEFARNVVGFRDAEHAEYDPYASTLFITPLSCSLAGQTMTVHITDHTRAASAYRDTAVTERYYCNFGLNPAYLDTIVQAGLVISGTDQDGEPRIIELPSLRFFVSTLFVPQVSSTATSPHPLLVAFIDAALGAPVR